MSTTKKGTVAEKKTSTVTKKQATADKKTSTVAKKQATANKKTSTVAKKQATADKKTSTVAKKQTTADKKTSTVAKKQTTAEKKTSTVAKKQATAEKKTSTTVPSKSYIIKVTFPNKSYRHIQFSENDTLENLHEMIMATTHFFDEHLHSFFMDGVAWNEDSEIGCRYDEETPFKRSDAYFTFKMLNLPVGYKFLYIFDFGDEWRFICRVMKILDEDTEFPTVILSKGVPPIQYPGFDDEDDDDEDDTNFIIK